MPNNVQSDIMNTVMATLIKRPGSEFGDPVLGLEVMSGPYQGVTFSFRSFTILPQQLDNGMVPMRHEVTIHSAPEGFTQDEAFDNYTTDVLIAWLQYIHMNDMSPLIRAKTGKHIHG